jgi:hypothetical protein
MRRSTKITIGVIVFLLICLIVGLTLYFVLRKKPSSSVPPSQPVLPTYTPQQELSNFLQTMKENLKAFTNDQSDLHRYHKTMIDQTDKKIQQQMMQQLITYQKSEWNNIKKFSSSLYQPIDKLLMNNPKYQQKFLKGYVALNNKINRYEQNINNVIKRGKDDNIVNVQDTSIEHLISDISFFLTMMQ